MRECIVYEHENLINGKRYFGITTKKPESRWGSGGIRYKKNKHFWSAIQKYGWDDGFAHKILFENLSEAEAREIEEMLISDYMTHDPKHGYNGTFGGELERPNEKTRRKISEALKGHDVSEKTRQKVSEANKTRDVSEETRQKMSEAHKGEKNHNYGKYPSEEARRKNSEAHKSPVEAINPETGLRAHYFASAKDAERAGFSRHCISKCCNGKNKTHKGYIWRLVERSE